MSSARQPAKQGTSAPPSAAREVAGTVAIIGRPNVGKSTLLNRLVGQKLAIVTPKPQTTRTRIVGVMNAPHTQIVFVDTPGVHKARGALNRFMVDEAMTALTEVDAVLFVIDAEIAARTVGRGHVPAAARRFDPVEREIVARLVAAKRPVVLCPNKVDTVKDKTVLFPMLEAWSKAGPWNDIVPVSAKSGSGVDRLVGVLAALLPEGPPLYGPDMLTDRTERFLVGELVREQLFLHTYQELPYSTAVVVDEWDERADRGDVVIRATILVERDSQKAIVVGRGGASIKDIGARARKEIVELLGRPAHLFLDVHVARDWTESPRGLDKAGYGSGGA